MWNSQCKGMEKVRNKEKASMFGSETVEEGVISNATGKINLSQAAQEFKR